MQVNSERYLKTIISAFIIVHFVMTITALSPDSIALRKAIAEVGMGPWKFAGMWQGWELFAPEIRNVNSHSVAIVQFEDGTVTEWPLPRPEQMGLAEKFRRDKFRKWNGDNVQWDRYREYWPDFARYVGRLHFDGTGPKPATFALMRFTGMVPDAKLRQKREDLPPHDQAYCPFFYTYKAEDFTR